MTLIDANQTSKQCFKTCVNRQLIIYINMVPSGVLLAHKMHFLCVFSMNTISFFIFKLTLLPKNVWIIIALTV